MQTNVLPKSRENILFIFPTFSSSHQTTTEETQSNPPKCSENKTKKYKEKKV